MSDCLASRCFFSGVLTSQMDLKSLYSFSWCGSHRAVLFQKVEKGRGTIGRDLEERTRMENGGFPGLQEAEKVSSGCCVDWVNVMDLGMTSVILIHGIVTPTLTIITTIRRLIASV